MDFPVIVPGTNPQPKIQKAFGLTAPQLETNLQRLIDAAAAGPDGSALRVAGLSVDGSGPGRTYVGALSFLNVIDQSTEFLDANALAVQIEYNKNDLVSETVNVAVQNVFTDVNGAIPWALTFSDPNFSQPAPNVLQYDGSAQIAVKIDFTFTGRVVAGFEIIGVAADVSGTQLGEVTSTVVTTTREISGTTFALLSPSDQVKLVLRNVTSTADIESLSGQLQILRVGPELFLPATQDVINVADAKIAAVELGKGTGENTPQELMTLLQNRIVALAAPDNAALVYDVQIAGGTAGQAYVAVALFDPFTTQPQ